MARDRDSAAGRPAGRASEVRARRCARWRGAPQSRRSQVRGEEPAPGTPPAFVAPQLATLVDAVPRRRRLAARDQVRRLPAAAACGRQGARAHPQRPRLDRQVRPAGEAARRARAAAALIDGEIIAPARRGVSSFTALQHGELGERRDRHPISTPSTCCTRRRGPAAARRLEAQGTARSAADRRRPPIRRRTMHRRGRQAVRQRVPARARRHHLQAHRRALSPGADATGSRSSASAAGVRHRRLDEVEARSARRRLAAARPARKGKRSSTRARSAPASTTATARRPGAPLDDRPARHRPSRCRPRRARRHLGHARSSSPRSVPAWTHDGRLRHASFQGLRERQAGRRSTGSRTAPAGRAAARADLQSREVTISHPDRVIFPDSGPDQGRARRLLRRGRR